MKTQSGLLPVYLKRVPTNDDVLKKYAPNAKKSDVLVYRDPKGTSTMARFPWHVSRRPTKRSTSVTINCYRWRVVWLPD